LQHIEILSVVVKDKDFLW